MYIVVLKHSLYTKLLYFNLTWIMCEVVESGQKPLRLVVCKTETGIDIKVSTLTYHSSCIRLP